MKSPAEFTDYYKRILKRDIERLESRRLFVTKVFSYKAAFRFILVFLVLAIIILIARSVSPEVSEYFKSSSLMLVKSNPIVTVFLLSIVLLVVITIARSIAFKPIVREYRNKIIPKVLSFVDPSLSLKSRKGISEKEFTDGDLFKAQSATSFSSEDLIEGTIDNIKVRLSNLTVTTEEEYIKSTGDASVQRNESEEAEKTRVKIINIFTGLYAICQPVGNAVPSKQSDSNEFGSPSKLIRKEVNGFVHIAFFENQVHVAIKGSKIFPAASGSSFFEPDITMKSFENISLIVNTAKR